MVRTTTAEPSTRSGDEIKREVARYRVTGSLPPSRADRVSSPADEDELVRFYSETRDPLVREDVVERFMPLARSLAVRYRGTTEQLEDLFQVAGLALVKALERFDPKRGKSFVAFAAPTILGELRRHFRDHVWELRLPRGLQERTMEARRAARLVSDELGRSPTVSQIAQRCEMSEEEVADALHADEMRRTLSLDAPTSPRDPESVRVVESLGHGEPGYEAVETQIAADSAELTERETRVLAMRFEDDLIQSEIANRIGVSQMQVSRIMRGALRKLFEAVDAGH